MSKLILLYTRDIDSATAEINAAGGHVTQIFSPNLFEATVPDEFAAESLAKSSVEPEQELDEASALLAEAWHGLEAQRAEGAGLESADERPISWDDPGFTPPGKIDRPPFPDAGAILESTGTPTSLRMVGSVAVGVVVVKGTAEGLGFTGAEQLLVLQQVMKGLQFLSASAPLGKLKFIYKTSFLTIDTPPVPGCSSYEGCESVWRDPALAQLGHASTSAFAQALRTDNNTDWAYVAFFTKYKLHHFAYAYDAVVCMAYANGSWGSHQIDRVFAHETCHIFGADDEYGSCGCGPSGELNVPNLNCRNCTAAQLDCLMNANTFSLCYWSRGQIGWFPTVADPMGAIAVDGGRPYVFVTGADKNLWLNWWSGSAWDWANQGLPPGVVITGLMGATAVDKASRPYVFARGSDGNLWANWWSGTAWTWSNQGKPASAAIAGSMGAITVDGGRPYVFVKGSDGNLWLNWWSGTAWAWASLGKPPSTTIGASLGAVTVDGGRPYVFVEGADGKLWLNWWSGTAWAWGELGKPPSATIAASLGAITVDGGRPYVFVKGSDGNLWVKWWSGTAWAWASQGKPPSTTIGASMGATTVDGGRPYVFVRGGDGNLWLNWWSGTAWAWANQGKPANTTVMTAMGAITVDGGRPYAFVKCADGNLWVNWWSGTAWSWSQQSYR